jgi:ATP-dependent Lon protease
MNKLDEKLNEHFAGLVVRKDLTKLVKGNAVVPSYVIEYLLGQYCATSDKDSIESGIETVKEILANHYVHRSEAGLIKSTIKEKGRHKIIDKVAVELNEKGGFYEAAFSNLGLKKVPIADDYIKKHPRLLVGGVWCISDMQYEISEDPKQEPWHIDSLKPIQVSSFDFDHYLAARKEFTTEEWLDILMQSIGFNPEVLGRRTKLLQLLRLIAYAERNFNYIELGPKGTGKSHIFSEFSPHGILISGGEITTPKLFVNNSSGKLGLVGYWDSVAFDEFAGKDKRVDKNLVDIMKGYMANKSFSRGVDKMGADASMSFLGNTKKSVPYMLKHSHFYTDLPDKYIDSAFLDRLHCYAPGWESNRIRAELFTDGFGFIVDYFAEILKHLRNTDRSQDYKKRFELDSSLSTRDLDGINKTFSGLMKILYPSGECTDDEMEELLRLAMEMRKRVYDHIRRIDDTFADVRFAFSRNGATADVKTLEEIQYPSLAGLRPTPTSDGGTDQPTEAVTKELPLAIEPEATRKNPDIPEQLESGKHVAFPENTTGISYRKLFEPYLLGARSITITDGYVRTFWQIKNMMELTQLIHDLVPEGEEAEVCLITKSDEFKCVEQDENLKKIEQTFVGSKVSFGYEYKDNDDIHARSIVTDTGWKISLDRGLDIFQRYDGGALSLASHSQESRACKAFEVTYLRTEKE